MPNQSGEGQADDDLEQATPQGLVGLEVPKGDVASGEKDGHEDETDEHTGSVGEKSG